MRRLLISVAWGILAGTWHPALATAGGLYRVGTAGAQELRIPVGPAAIATGGAGVAHAGGLSTLFWNPASIASTDASQALVSYTTYLADSKLNYGAVSKTIGDGSLALSVKVLNIGDITVTTEEAPEGTGEILHPNFAVLGLSYGRRMTDRVLVGATGMFVSEQVAQTKAHGIAFDLGVQYDTGWRGLRFGFAMKNVGPQMRFDGPELEERLELPDSDPMSVDHVVRLRTASFELPSYVQLGMAYDLPFGGDRGLTLLGAFHGNNFSTDEYRVGGEFRLGQWLALRAGFTGQLALDEQERAGDYLYSVSYGAGLNFKLGDRPMAFDWAGNAVGQTFDDIQQFSLGIDF